MKRDNMVGIISDTHDNMDSIRKAVEVFNDAGCSLIIHAGDYVSPFTVREFEKLEGKLIGVFGNNDGEKKGLSEKIAPLGTLHRAPHEFTYGGKNFALMHEPYFLNDYDSASAVDVVVYGHTHISDIKYGKPMIINPGECCSWLYGRSTVVLLDISTMRAELINL